MHTNWIKNKNICIFSKQNTEKKKSNLAKCKS